MLLMRRRHGGLWVPFGGPRAPIWPYQIDWDSPLAHGLIAYAVPGSGHWVELVRGNSGSPSGYAAGVVPHRFDLVHGVVGEFDGTDDKISIANTAAEPWHPGGTAGGTLALWLNRDVTSSNKYYFSLEIAGNVGWFAWSGSAANCVAVSRYFTTQIKMARFPQSGSGDWRHIVLADPELDSTTSYTSITAYQDGVALSSNSTDGGTGTPSSLGGPIVLGGRTSDNLRQHDGALGHCAAWSRQLSQEEAIQLSHPLTRWSLLWEPGRSVYVFVSTGGAPHTVETGGASSSWSAPDPTRTRGQRTTQVTSGSAAWAAPTPTQTRGQRTTQVTSGSATWVGLTPTISHGQRITQTGGASAAWSIPSPRVTRGPFALIASTLKKNTSGSTGNVTTDAIDTTGASLLVIAISYHSLGGVIESVTDSKGNTWTPLTIYAGSGNPRIVLYYCVGSITVGTGHTVNVSGPSNWPTVTFSAWRANNTVALEDEDGGGAGSTTAITSPTVVPAGDGRLILSAVCVHDGTNIVETGPLELLHAADHVGSQSMGAGLAFEIQPFSEDRAATWEWSGAHNSAVAIALFRVLVQNIVQTGGASATWNAPTPTLTRGQRTTQVTSASASWVGVTPTITQGGLIHQTGGASATWNGVTPTITRSARVSQTGGASATWGAFAPSIGSQEDRVSSGVVISLTHADSASTSVTSGAVISLTRADSASTRVTSGGIIVLSHVAIETRITSGYVLVLSRPTTYQCGPAADGENPCGKDDFFPWVVWSLDNWYRMDGAGIDLGDGNGAMDPRVLSYGPITRALADETGSPVVASGQVTLADTDRWVRGKQATVRPIRGTEIIINALSQQGIDTAATPRTLMQGIVEDAVPTGDLKVELTLTDSLGNQLFGGLFGEDTPAQRRLLTPEDFPTIPTENAGLPAPIIYNFAVAWAADLNLAGGACYVYTGTRTLLDGNSYHEFVVAGHACKEFIDLWVFDDQYGGGQPRTKVTEWNGNPWAVPGKGNWAALTGSTTYRVFNGRAYTCFYGRVGNAVADGVAAGQGYVTGEDITVRYLDLALRGIETSGTGGGSLITSAFQQYLHVLVNFLLPQTPWQSGVWLTMPKYAGPNGEPDGGACLIDPNSFYAAENESFVRVPGQGYIGALQFGIKFDGGTPSADNPTARELIQRMNTSWGCRSGLNKNWQVVVHLIPDVEAITPSALEVFFDDLDILEGTQRFIPEHEVVTHYLAHAYDTPGGWGGSEPIGDDSAAAIYGRVDAELDMHYAANYDINTLSDGARDVVQRTLMLMSRERMYYEFQTGMCGLYRADVGDVIRVTTFAGVHSSGWTDRLIWVHKIGFDPDTLTTTVYGLDITGLNVPESLCGAGTVVYEETFDAGNADTGHMQVDDWEGNAGDDSVYPYLVHTEVIQVIPYQGTNVLWWWDNPNDVWDNPNNCGAVFEGFTPVGGHAAPVDGGAFTCSYFLDQAGFDSNWAAYLVSMEIDWLALLINPTTTPPEECETWSLVLNYGDEDLGNQWIDSHTFQKADTINQLHEFQVCWQNSTWTWDPWSVAADGWIKVWWNGTLIYHITDIKFLMRSWDAQESGVGTMGLFDIGHPGIPGPCNGFKVIQREA